MTLKKGHVYIPDVKQINAVELGAQRKSSSSNPPACCSIDSPVITNKIKIQESVELKIVNLLSGITINGIYQMIHANKINEIIHKIEYSPYST